jgi:Ca2+-binding RTX toxin-like protein
MGTTLFYPATNFATGSNPSQVLAADLNGDGKIDLITANHGSGDVSVLFGNGAGSFSAPVNYASGAGTIAIALSDVNGDGIRDLVGANPFGDDVSVLLGTASGTFQPPAHFSTGPGSGPRSVVLADFNHDGVLDIATGDAGSGGSTSVSVLLGSGSGSFSGPTLYGVNGANPWPIATADLNGDGNLDLVTGRDFVSVLLGAADGTFSAPTTYSEPGHSIVSLAIGDVNGDGKLDLVTANTGANTISVLMGTGNGTFAPEVTYASFAGPYAITLGDLDGDGRLDIGVANAGGNTVSVLFNTGNGAFAPQTIYSVGSGAYGITFGDVNGDGRLDISAVNYSSNTVSVLLNESPPAITSNGGGATAAVSVAENATAITTVTASDPDAGQTLSYSISGGFDGNLFMIDSQTGALGFVTAPDYENPNINGGGFDQFYDVQVRATDSFGAFDDQLITVTVTDAVENGAPAITSNGGGATAVITISENGAVVTTVTATDPDVGDALTYSIAGGFDGDQFAINSQTGALSFLQAPDFESPTDAGSDNIYDVTVAISDGNGGADTQAIAVTVTNVVGISSPASNAATITGTNEDDVLTGLGGANTLLGLAGNDLLNGGSGNDTLDGGAGADSMAGGAGNDNYVVDNVGDAIIENTGAGTDTVRTPLVTYSIAALVNVENLIFVGTGPFNGTGNGLANVITGGSGNDIIDGGAGTDRMVGGLGDDTYHVGSAPDIVTEETNAGTDLVLATSSAFSLGANVENLTFIGAGNFTGTGNGANNAMTGGVGDDTLDGRGGDDVIIGGSGADALIGAGGADLLNGGIGADRIEGGGGDDVLIGGSDADELFGDGGADLLDGGLGADRMNGGGDDDTYIVDSALDVVAENPGAGTDEVQTDLQTFTLSANVEKLSFTGSGSFAGGGNGLNNIVTGGASGDALAGGGGNDRLLGLGGNDTLSGEAGADVLDGGTGNDVLIGGAGNDTFVFHTGLGNDTINAFGDVGGNNDHIQFSTAVFANFNAVIVASRQVGTDVIIFVDANNSVTLTGVAVSTLGANDFSFI